MISLEKICSMTMAKCVNASKSCKTSLGSNWKQSFKRTFPISQANEMKLLEDRNAELSKIVEDLQNAKIEVCS